MKKVPLLRSRLTPVLGVLLALTACDRPESAEVPLAPESASLTGASLLECPSNTLKSRSATVDLLGGVVSFAGNVVMVPAGALLTPIEIEIAVPASDYPMVDLRVNGQEHWQFRLPVVVTLDYSRCRVGLLAAPLTVWHVDPETGEMLEHMGGIDNRLLRQITFTTDHFSGYAIAN